MAGEQLFTNRPSFPAQIDWSHPLSKGLVSCYLFNETGGMQVFDSGYKQAHGKASGTKPTSFGRLYASGNYVEATTPHLDFTASDFSGWVWVKTTNLTASNYVFNRGLASTDGWKFAISSAGAINFTTSQAAADQQSYSNNGEVVTGTWYFLAFTRAGAVGKVYKNAVNVTTTSGNHVNPLTSARTLKIGAYDDLTLALIGTIGMVGIHNRALSAQELQSLYLNPYDMFLQPGLLTGSNLPDAPFLIYDGGSYLSATVANAFSAYSLGTYELTGFVSSSTANAQTLFASNDTADTTTKFVIRVTTAGLVEIVTRENAGTINQCRGAINVCDGEPHDIALRSSGTTWSLVIDGVADTLSVIGGSNTGDWFADIGLVADRNNITIGVDTTTSNTNFAIAVMGQHRIYSRELSTTECLANHQAGRSAPPSDPRGLVYNLPCDEGTGNPVDTIGGLTMVRSGRLPQWQNRD